MAAESLLFPVSSRTASKPLSREPPWTTKKLGHPQRRPPPLHHHHRCCRHTLLFYLHSASRLKIDEILMQIFVAEGLGEINLQRQVSSDWWTDTGTGRMISVVRQPCWIVFLSIFTGLKENRYKRRRFLFIFNPGLIFIPLWGSGPLFMTVPPLSDKPMCSWC